MQEEVDWTKSDPPLNFPVSYVLSMMRSCEVQLGYLSSFPPQLFLLWLSVLPFPCSQIPGRSGSYPWSGCCVSKLNCLPRAHLAVAFLDEALLQEVQLTIHVPRVSVQELVAEAQVLLSVLFSLTRVFEAGELHGEVQFSIIRCEVGDKRDTE